MQIGTITVGGRIVGVVALSQGSGDNRPFLPDLDGYEPQGRASEGTPHHGAPPHARHPYLPHGEPETPPRGRPFAQGSSDVNAAITSAAKSEHLDPDTLRAIASIESSMNPDSNAHRETQYKGLYQIGREEWHRFGEGNIYSARSNAFAAARMFAANRAIFEKKFGRAPSDTELYMMHQQGLGFYTRGAMTNIQGNPYPGMHGPQTHASFEAGWGREVERRKAAFAAEHARTDLASGP